MLDGKVTGIQRVGGREHFLLGKAGLNNEVAAAKVGIGVTADDIARRDAEIGIHWRAHTFGRDVQSIKTIERDGNVDGLTTFNLSRWGKRCGTRDLGKCRGRSSHACQSQRADERQM